MQGQQVSLPYLLAASNHSMEPSIPNSRACVHVEVMEGGAAAREEACQGVVVHLLAASEAEDLELDAAARQSPHGLATDLTSFCCAIVEEQLLQVDTIQSQSLHTLVVDANHSEVERLQR